MPLVFETDCDGRTFAGAAASFFVIVVFMSFFLKPLTVTLPFAARFTDGGGSQPCAGAHREFSESGNRDSGGEGRRGRRWRGLRSRS